MRHLDLFSGIGGFALATEMVWSQGGVEHIFCDNEPFSQAILKKHWPKSIIYGDIRTLTAHSYIERYIHREFKEQSTESSHKTQREPIASARPSALPTIDLLTGGFPCQPFSNAGRRRGTEDDRHLWPEMLRVIQEFNPRWIIGENVGGFVTWNGGMVLEQVHTDLEAAGYEVQAFIIPAVALNAPHRRDRVWIVGHSKYDGQHGSKDRKGSVAGSDGNTQREEQIQQPARPTSSRNNATNANPSNDIGGSSKGSRNGKRMEENQQERKGSRGKSARRVQDGWGENWLEVATRLCTLDDGLSSGLPRPKGWRNAALKGAGNAIVPQVAAEIMRAIKAVDNF